jgi:hypothetical protein
MRSHSVSLLHSRCTLGLRAMALTAAFLAGAGCTLSTGSFAGVMSTGNAANVGQTVESRLHLAEKDGVVFGMTGQLATRAGLDRCCSEWRALGSAGYALVPTSTSSAVGFDAVALLGGGWMPSRSATVEGGVLAGAKVAMPIRVTRRRELWQSDDYVGTSWQVVPDITVLGLGPFGAVDKRVDAEIAFGFSVRFFMYSAILP